MIRLFIPTRIWKEFRVWLILAGTSLVLLLGQFLGANQLVRQQLLKSLLPLFRFNANAVHQAMQPFLSIGKIKHSAYRVQDLERRLAEADAALGELSKLREENITLKKILQNSDRGMADSVIASPILSWAQPALAAGSNQGVTQGSAVLYQQTLLARVSRVEADVSYLTLLKDRSLQPVLVETESGVQGLIRGDGRRVLLTEVPIESEVKIGERVVTLGQAGIEPGLFVGEVVNLDHETSAAVQKAVLEQFVSFYEAVVLEVR